MSTKSLVGSLPIYAQHLAEKTGVKVFVEGSVAYTNVNRGGVLMLQHVKGEGFKQPVILESEMEVVVDRFRHKRGQRVFSPQGA